MARPPGRHADPFWPQLTEGENDEEDDAKEDQEDGLLPNAELPALQGQVRILRSEIVLMVLQAMRPPMAVNRREPVVRRAPMDMYEMIRSFVAEDAVNAVLNLKDASPGLGGQFPKHCRTAYTIGWLDALACACRAIRATLENDT